MNDEWSDETDVTVESQVIDKLYVIGVVCVSFPCDAAEQ
jgi:hypothetical protein